MQPLPPSPRLPLACNVVRLLLAIINHASDKCRTLNLDGPRISDPLQIKADYAIGIDHGSCLLQ